MPPDTAGWVCLMYHDVVPDHGQARVDIPYYSVTVRDFAAHLDAIAGSGLHGCSVEEYIAAPSADRIVITFDDGNAGQYEHGFRLLRERGMSATFFVTTDWVDTPDFVTWEQLRIMKDAGMSVQSHTRSHPFLSETHGKHLHDELHGSKAALDGGLDQDTATLALPGGDFPRHRDRPILTEAGYRVVCTSRWGLNPIPRRWGDDALLPVRRCTVRRDTSLEIFQRIIAGDVALSRRQRTREVVLGVTRRMLGPSRYAVWRRRALRLRLRRAEGTHDQSAP